MLGGYFVVKLNLGDIAMTGICFVFFHDVYYASLLGKPSHSFN